MTLDEERALAAVAHEAIKEMRARRRWKIAFRIVMILLVLLYVAAIATRGFKRETLPKGDFVAMVRVNGVISADDYANAEDVNQALGKAFAAKGVKAVFVDINSPGGSPVQSGKIYREIMRLKQEHKVPTYAFINDMGASGAYYVAAAADKIYADPSSVVGSIGVISQGMGYGDLLDKLGLQNRTYKAGEHKDFLNGAKPEDPQELAHMQGLLDNLHQQFITAVKTGRGERLQDNPDLFSGLFWSGEQALALGLVDALDDMTVVLKSEFKNAEVVDYTAARSMWEEVLRHTAMQSKASLRQIGGVGEQVEAILRK
ncbi:signal peptide peptidase SppA [Suttonella indologenes]|uniref:Probable protease sohB n=1 Tax=Suttonella indologenes TaxID=13276 RepID=A0A380N3Y2_9GAMM|nr:signal peptide peptidase SppA [Suttonella indologenes]SUO98527.1 Probable protease sohB [Suttonella indologenes]